MVHSSKIEFPCSCGTTNTPTYLFSQNSRCLLNPEGEVLPEKLGGGVQYASQNPYCWFSVSRLLKIDQNKNQNRSIDKVQNLGNERR